MENIIEENQNLNTNINDKNIDEIEKIKTHINESKSFSKPENEEIEQDQDAKNIGFTNEMNLSIKEKSENLDNILNEINIINKDNSNNFKISKEEENKKDAQYFNHNKLKESAYENENENNTNDNDDNGMN